MQNIVLPYDSGVPQSSSIPRLRLVPQAGYYGPGGANGIAPQMGTLASSDTVKAFARSAGGWLHVDGTAVSQGTLPGCEPLRSVESVRHVADRLLAVQGVIECLRHRDFAKGRDALPPMDAASRKAALKDLDAQAGENHPLPDAAGELAALGWYKVELYMEGDTQVFGCVPSTDVPTEIREGIGRLAMLYKRGTVDFDEAAPVVSSVAEEGPRDYGDLAAEDFERHPDFAGYDPETRTVSFRHTDLTVTIPGGPDWSPPERAEAAFSYR